MWQSTVLYIDDGQVRACIIYIDLGLSILLFSTHNTSALFSAHVMPRLGSGMSPSTGNNYIVPTLHLVLIRYRILLEHATFGDILTFLDNLGLVSISFPFYDA